MKVHGVYIPDAISSILRMSLLIQNGSESELCVYSGCHFVYVADVTSASTKTMNVHCFYIPDANFALTKQQESECCLYPDASFVYK